MNDERAALVALAHGVEPADPKVGRMVAMHGAGEVLDRVLSGTSGLAHEEGIRARLQRHLPGAPDAHAASVDAHIITRVDRQWPTQLDDLGELAPLALWVRGAAELRLLCLRSLAIVGARACTAYGEHVARSWSAEVGSAGWTVVSGGAYGIDAAAHRGALAAGAATICVVAGGVDVAYPRGHSALLARVAEDGLLVSETPPGESVRRERFLSRNRLIAALTRATLVVEAAVRSGTTATARSAQLLNRPVLAVPGPVTSPASSGCHRMIREGDALLVCDAGDLLSLLDLDAVATVEAEGRLPASARDALGSRERRVLDALPARRSASTDDLVAAAALPIGDVLTALGLLEVQGWIDADGGSWRLARRG